MPTPKPPTLEEAEAKRAERTEPFTALCHYPMVIIKLLVLVGLNYSRAYYILY